MASATSTRIASTGTQPSCAAGIRWLRSTFDGSPPSASNDQGEWHLSGWLDWEFAWAGDPAWDHMRTDVQRLVDFGLTPDAWWAGYGSRPAPLNLAVAVLHFMLWKSATADVESRDAAVASAWMADLSTHLGGLESLLA